MGKLKQTMIEEMDMARECGDLRGDGVMLPVTRQTIWIGRRYHVSFIGCAITTSWMVGKLSKSIPITIQVMT